MTRSGMAQRIVAQLAQLPRRSHNNGESSQGSRLDRSITFGTQMGHVCSLNLDAPRGFLTCGLRALVVYRGIRQDI